MVTGNNPIIYKIKGYFYRSASEVICLKCFQFRAIYPEMAMVWAVPVSRKAFAMSLYNPKSLSGKMPATTSLLLLHLYPHPFSIRADLDPAVLVGA